MVFRLDKKRLAATLLFITALIIAGAYLLTGNVAAEEKDKSYIKWAELNVSLSALKDTVKLDIDTYGMLYHISFIDSLSYLACKNGNDFSSYKKADLDKMLEALGEIYTIDDLMKDNKYYTYHKEAFSAMLSGLLGVYETETTDENGKKKTEKVYGLKAYSPIAKGYSYSHYDDFGVSRSYGYKRTHLGNDLMGNIGTPIVSVEDGTVEAIGWNQYGGWRLGIRSTDGKRSYYYAHLRKDTPYADKIKLGTKVKAGQIIGYMGMTGYSTQENVNGMSVPHLHFGLQLIFDESQKEGSNQIWLDVYNLVRLLSDHKARVTS